MSVPSPTPRTRVVLGATCYADAAASLQVALVLAQQISGDLLGCFCADDAIIASVSYPNARAVSYSGRRFPSVSAQSMRAALHADARKFEEHLISEARRASLRAAFTRARGPLSDVLQQAPGAGDLVVFGFRRGLDGGDSIAVLCGEGRPDPQALALGAALSRRFGKTLSIFTTPAFHGDIADHLSELHVPRYDLQPYTGIDAARARLDRMSLAALVVGVELPDVAAALRLMDAARCPVVVPIHKLTSGTGASSAAPTDMEWRKP